MNSGNCNRRRLAALALGLAIVIGTARSAGAQPWNDGFVLFFDEYLHGDYYYAYLGDVDRDEPYPIQPRKLKLPWWLDDLEIGNADVSADGRTMIFAARNTSDYDWNIYAGTLDLRRSRIADVRIVVGGAGRDEDPRFSWDAGLFIYKCDGNICVYPEIVPNPAIVSPCELWGPSLDRSGYIVSYTKRCGGPGSDRIWEYSVLSGQETEVANQGGGADRFAQYLDDGRLVYSHIDTATGTSSLWVHDAGTVMLLHDRTDSDDDPYPDKHDRDHVAFVGWEGGGYNLFIYRRSRNDSVRLTSGMPILAPVLFRSY